MCLYVGGYRKYFLMLIYELNSYQNWMEEKKNLKNVWPWFYIITQIINHNLLIPLPSLPFLSKLTCSVVREPA